MSRSDQYIGLCPAARVLLKTQEEPAIFEVTATFKDGTRRIINRIENDMILNCEVEVVGTIHGAFDSEMPLKRYRFRDGRVFVEYVQADPWSSGPCYFIALKDGDGNLLPEYQWTDKQIQEELGGGVDLGLEEYADSLETIES